MQGGDLLFPKKMKKRKKKSSRMDCCAEAKHRAVMMTAIGCIICGSPACIHHIRDGYGMGQKAPWYETIPLCPEHHVGDFSTHGRNRKQFHAAHGSERELLARTDERITHEVQRASSRCSRLV